MKTNTNAGIAHLAALAIVVLVAIIGFAGWQVSKHNKPAPTVTKSIKSSSITQTVPATISTKSDIKSAITVTENTVIDSDLDTSSFDADISSLQ